MRYLLMIYTSEAEDAKRTPEEGEANMKAYYAFTKEVTDSGHYLGGEALQPISSATSVRVRDSEVITSDGPFAETKEQLGGYYIIDCEHMDEAIRWASQVPSAIFGSVEIRPIMVYG